MNLIYSFPPVERPDSRLLILGSMPSEKSLAQGFYYAHPHNAFWPIVAELLGEDCPSDVDGRRALLLRHRVALWDVAHSCVRAGSLDSAMRQITPNDIGAFLAAHPRIAAVAVNGSQALKLLRKQQPHLRVPVLALPSTSPAYTLPRAEKARLWREALESHLPKEETT